MDRASLCEKALNRLGSRRLENDSECEKACNEWYEYTMRQANAMYNWSFAKVRVVLTPSAPGVFDLPFDCLKVVLMQTSVEFQTEARDPELIGRQIFTHGETPASLTITYISDLVAAGGHIPDYANPHYEEGCVTLLAANMAVELTGRFDVQDGLRQQAQIAFQRAITHDRQQDFSRAKHPLTRLLGENIMGRRGRR